MAQREVPVLDTEGGGRRGDRAAELEPGTAVSAGDDLAVVPQHPERGAEGLGDGLLRGEPAGERGVSAQEPVVGVMLPAR